MNRLSSMKECDVAIVGGGMVGASFALALRATRLRVLLIESVPPDSAAQPSFDERTTALGNGSRQIFESLGVWQAMAAESAPIRSIHVSDAGRFGVARLEAREQGVPAFGYVVPNRVIGRVLWQALRESLQRDAGRARAAEERDSARRWRAARRLVQDGKSETDARRGRRGCRWRRIRIARQRGHRGGRRGLRPGRHRGERRHRTA